MTFAIRCGAVAAALLSLAGCTGSRVYGSAGPVEQQATVIVGLAVSGAPRLNTVRLKWQQYDAASETLMPKEFVIERSLVGCGAIKMKDPEECALGQVHRDALAIPAGDYVLVSIFAVYPGKLQTTSFLRLEKNTFAGHHVQTSGSIGGSKAPRYHFDAGEVAYVGDWVFDVARLPAHLVSFRRDDAAAQAALAAHHPEIQGEIAFRLPLGVAPQALPDDVMLQLEGVPEAASTSIVQ